MLYHGPGIVLAWDTISFIRRKGRKKVIFSLRFVRFCTFRTRLGNGRVADWSEPALNRIELLEPDSAFFRSRFKKLHLNFKLFSFLHFCKKVQVCTCVLKKWRIAKSHEAQRSLSKKNSHRHKNQHLCSAQTRTGIGHLRKPPAVELIPCRRKPLRRRSTLRDPARTQVWSEQVWLDATFISQGSRSWGKLAVETWRVKTELIIITILHITITTTLILNLRFKTIAPKILANTKCINKYWKYTQIFAATKSSKILKYWCLPKILANT